MTHPSVLVIGGTRFVGYLAAARLLAGGHRVALLNRGRTGDPFGDRVEHLRGDRRRDLARLVDGRRFDAVLDLAAYDGDDVRGAVAALGGRIGHYVLVSSGQVYLLRDGAPRPPIAAREEDYDGPLIPRPPGAHDGEEWDYGAGKRAAEDALAVAIAGGFPATAVRLPMVHGERDYHGRLDAYLGRLLDGGPILCPGADRPVRHVYGAAAARVLVDLAGRGPTGRAYNVAQRETPTLGALLGQLAALVGAAGAIVDVPAARLVAAGLDPLATSPLSGAWMSFVDPGRAERELGFVHEPLAEYLGRIVASYLARAPAPPDPAVRARERALAAGAAPA
jgi:nucleoside-diphosphate-sugar epimerase